MSGCSDQAYGDFGGGLVRACGGARIPLNGSFEITFRCNLRCVHCYIDDFSGRGELSTADVKRILSETADEGCLWMLLTGGEVLTRRDFPEIYLHAKRLGFLLTVFSNGTLWDERIADLMAEYPPFGIEFTLYGLSDETYLKTTGFPGRFTRVRRAIDLVLERRLPLSLKAVAMEPLAAEIAPMQALAASLGVRFRYDAMIQARLDGSMIPTAVRNDPERAVGYDAGDPARFADWAQFYRTYGRTARPSPFVMSCGAGINTFHVDPKGTLLACQSLPLNGYDLRRGSFRDGWYGIVGDLLRREASPANVCTGCELKGMCDRCPATATLETGSPDGWIPYYCEVTHRRAALLEESSGNADAAARYRAHAERVAGGWTPPGAILPRAVPSGAAAACGSGGCATGCGAPKTQEASASNLLQIEIPQRGSDVHPEVQR